MISNNLIITLYTLVTFRLLYINPLFQVKKLVNILKKQ